MIALNQNAVTIGSLTMNHSTKPLCDTNRSHAAPTSVSLSTYSAITHSPNSRTHLRMLRTRITQARLHEFDRTSFTCQSRRPTHSLPINITSVLRALTAAEPLIIKSPTSQSTRATKSDRFDKRTSLKPTPFAAASIAFYCIIVNTRPLLRRRPRRTQSLRNDAFWIH
jgi:hypothetical protein